MIFNLTRKTIDKSILTFFIFGSFFISIRLLLIGSAASQSAGEYILAMLPECFMAYICSLFFFLKIKNNEKIRLNLIDWLLAFYIVSNVVIGFWIGKDFKIGLYGFRMTYFPMLFYFIGSLSLSAKIEMDQLLAKIFKWFVVVGALGLILYFFFFDFNKSMLLKVSPIIPEYFIIRMTSVFWSPVVFGTFSAIAFLYFYYQSLSSNSYWNYFFQGILFSCTLMSMSRGSMIGLIAGVIILTVLSKNWKKMMLSTGLTIVLFIPFSFYIDTPLTVAKWVINSTTNTVQMKKGDTRVDLNRSAISEIKNNPWGRGLGKAGHVAVRFSKTQEEHSSSQSQEDLSLNSTDGWFVKLASETGIFGLITYFITSLVLFIFSVKHFLKNGFDIFGFLLTIFMVVNIQNLVSNVLDFYLFSYLYWFLIGIIVFHLKADKQLEKS